jgi:hypothetical protein
MTRLLAPDSDSPNAGLRVAARTLALDAFAGELARALGSVDVRCILLKGPSVAAWLYDDGELRGYVDIDVLVQQRDWDGAAAVLSAAGFEPSRAELALPYGRRPHAETWVRGGDGVTVDVHDTVAGIGVAPELAWDVLAVGVEPMTILGSEIDVLGEAARALLVALHAAHHGIEDAQALDDLGRALVRVPDATWREAKALAEQLEATPAFGAGLRLTDAGARLAERLELPSASSVETILRAGSAPELALSLDWLVRTQGVRPRLRLILRKLFPPVSVLRGRSTLARRSGPGLGAAYLLQPFWLSRQAVPAVRAWLAARKRAR